MKPAETLASPSLFRYPDRGLSLGFEGLFELQPDDAYYSLISRLGWTATDAMRRRRPVCEELCGLQNPLGLAASTTHAEQIFQVEAADASQPGDEAPIQDTGPRGVWPAVCGKAKDRTPPEIPTERAGRTRFTQSRRCKAGRDGSGRKFKRVHTISLPQDYRWIVLK